MASIPSALALALVPDNSFITASPHRNNYAAIQAAVNALVALLGGGAAGQFLQALDGTDVQWGNAADKSSSATQTFVGNIQTGGQLLSNSVVIAGRGSFNSGAKEVFLGDVFGDAGVAGLRLGVDTNLYRTAANALKTDGSLTVGASVKSTSPSAGVGYATGAGGSVTQITSQTTAVTLNTACGKITMFNAAFNTGAIVTFTVNNSTVAAGDLIVVNAGVGGVIANAVAANGSFAVTLYNAGPNTFTGQVNFAVIKAVTA